MIKQLTINYNKKLLLEESKKINYKPFESGYKEDSWFDYQPNWLYGKINRNDICNFCEIYKVMNYIVDKTGVTDIRPRIYKQLPNIEVPIHVDLSTKSAINIILNNNYAPITFDEIGDVIYECALFDTTKKHMVKAHSELRIVLKFSIFDKSFEELKCLI